MNYTYTLTSGSAVVRSDGAVIPADPGNADYQMYLAWVAAGNTAAPVPVAAPVTIMSPLVFMARIPAAQTTAILTAAQTAPAIMNWLLQLTAAEYIDVADPRTLAGIDALVAAGFIPANLTATILAPAA